MHYYSLLCCCMNKDFLKQFHRHFQRFSKILDIQREREEMASKNDIKVTLDTDKKDELEKWKKSPLEVFVSTRILQVDNIDDGEGI